MFKKTAVTAFRLPVLLVIAWSTTVCAVQAQDVTLKDAIQCKDFKRAADGSWHAEDISITYGSNKNQLQLNLFGATTIRKGTPFGEIDLWTLLNDKCGSGQ
ncbi:MAG: hypothetical protein ACLQIQ_11205 [Beijerinckiaceae bacterium]